MRLSFFQHKELWSSFFVVEELVPCTRDWSTQSTCLRSLRRTALRRTVRSTRSGRRCLSSYYHSGRRSRSWPPETRIQPNTKSLYDVIVTTLQTARGVQHNNVPSYCLISEPCRGPCTERKRTHALQHEHNDSPFTIQSAAPHKMSSMAKRNEAAATQGVKTYSDWHTQVKTVNILIWQTHAFVVNTKCFHPTIYYVSRGTSESELIRGTGAGVFPLLNVLDLIRGAVVL